MRKLSEIKNEQALDLIADVIEPFSRILADEKINEFRKNTPSRTEVMKWVIKDHKSEVIEILAALDGKPVETYEISVLELPMRVIEILNDEDMISLFTSQGQRKEKTSSGSATVNTGARGH